MAMNQIVPVEAVMRALADPTRRAIFEQVARSGEIQVKDLTGQRSVTQGAISQHLKMLKEAGLVYGRADGRNVFYRARPEGLTPLTDWISHYSTFWRERFSDLRDLLEEME